MGLLGSDMQALMGMAQQGGGQGMGGMGMGGMGGMGMYGAAGGGGVPANFRQGDWMCQCGAHNYASKAACHKCHTPKPLQTTQMM